ncbi:substrate-binding domain-containing protein [Cohnella caldifontis]|uniref:substrate-binding domain-containing protein n=1 Tax=Cohnella caldifontis TaxID=3027471 RepID=UPI0023ED3CDB|nr:substrate-binding domain-containing protein [Cohnella sp. YIM B05605]
MTGFRIRLSAALFAMALLAACTRQGEIPSAEDSQKEIALIAKSRGEFWSTVKMGAEAAAKELGVKLTFDAPEQETDVAGQIDRVNRYLAYGVDGMVIAASDYERLAAPAESAESRGVPVVAIESEIDSGKIRSFVGIDNYEAGRQAARKMKEIATGQGRFLILGYLKGARNTEERERGILDEWAGDPDILAVRTAPCSLDAHQCADMVKDLIAREGPFDGILALNASAAAGAAEQISRMKRIGGIKLVGFDNSPEELEWLQEGVIQATVIQNPFSIGYLGVKTAVEALEHKPVEKRIDTGTKVIDAESMFWSDNQKLLFPFVQ